MLRPQQRPPWLPVGFQGIYNGVFYEQPFAGIDRQGQPALQEQQQEQGQMHQREQEQTQEQEQKERQKAGKACSDESGRRVLPACYRMSSFILTVIMGFGIAEIILRLCSCWRNGVCVVGCAWV